MYTSIGTCSSMVALGNSTASGATIHAKNSDRPLNEAQPLCFYPAADYPEGSEVECTYIRIPQVRHTYACIGSRPYSIFGFEHGVNECGVSIGNEAVSGREFPERRWGLLGMDILRLALERSDTAANAVAIMGDLLETYGSGGDPRQRAPMFNANYIIADPKEAYLFESSQRCWVAKKVKDVGFLANCYSIQDDYDLIGKNTYQTVISKGWALPGDKFNAAKVFSRDDCIFADVKGFLRYPRLRKLMQNREPLTPKMMMNNLRDHYEGELPSTLLYSPSAAKIPSICSHSGGLSGSTSAASIVSVLKSDAPDPFRFVYWGSMSPPCCSIFRPFFNINWLPEDLQHAHALYRNTDQWWIFIELERYISLNYDKFSVKVKEGFHALEDQFIEEADHLEKTFDGNIAPLKEFSMRASEQSFKLAKSFLNEIKTKLKREDIDRMMLTYFTQSAEGCGMPYDKNIIR
jgi:secernin